METVKQLAELSAPAPRDPSAVSSQTSVSTKGSHVQPKDTQENHSGSASELTEPQPETKSAKSPEKSLSAEEEWVLVATGAAFLSKSCLGDPVRVKTKSVNMNGAGDEWLLVDTASTACESTAPTESM